MQTYTTLIKENICSVCKFNLQLIECQGKCRRYFHYECLGFFKKPEAPFKCEECTTNVYACFACKKESTEDNLTTKCLANKCGRYFHETCVKSNQLFRLDNSNSNKFVCPSHTCITCWVDNKHNLINFYEAQELWSSSAVAQRPFKGKLMKCVRCTNSYHAGDFCLAAGSLILAGSNIICPSHFAPQDNIIQQSR